MLRLSPEKRGGVQMPVVAIIYCVGSLTLEHERSYVSGVVESGERNMI